MPIDIDIHTVGDPEADRHIVWNHLASQEYDIDAGPGIHWLGFDPDRWVLKRWALPGIPELVSDLGAGSSADEPAGAIHNIAQVATGLHTQRSEGHAFMWLVEPCYGLDRGLIDLGTLDGDVSSIAYGINDYRQIVGESADANGATRAFIWLPEPAFGEEESGMYPVGNSSPASCGHAINEVGQVVGFSADPNDPNDYHATLWQYDYASAGWQSTNLGTLGGDQLSVAWDINNAAQVVGWSGDDPNNTHAVIWEYDAESGAWTITDLDPDKPDKAYCINELGQVGGYANNQATIWTFDVDADEWSSDTLPTRTGGGPDSVVYGINNVGQAVGQAEEHALLWEWEQDPNDPNGVWVATDLNDHVSGLETCGPLRAGWDIDDGGLIVGYWDMTGQADPRVFVMDVDAEIADCDGNGTLDACDIA